MPCLKHTTCECNWFLDQHLSDLVTSLAESDNNTFLNTLMCMFGDNQPRLRDIFCNQNYCLYYIHKYIDLIKGHTYQMKSPWAKNTLRQLEQIKTLANRFKIRHIFQRAIAQNTTGHLYLTIISLILKYRKVHKKYQLVCLPCP